MSDAPKTIWATKDFYRWAVDSGKILKDHGSETGVEYTLTASVAARLKAAEELADMVELFCKNKATIHQLVRSYFAYRATKEIPE